MKLLEIGGKKVRIVSLGKELFVCVRLQASKPAHLTFIGLVLPPVLLFLCGEYVPILFSQLRGPLMLCFGYRNW